MSDKSTEAAETPVSSPKKPVPKAVRYVIFAIIIIIIWTIPIFLGNLNTKRAKVDTFKQSVNALAVAVREPVLVKDNDKLRVLAGEMAERGDFESITFTDQTGKVLATTDRTKENTTIESLKKPPLTTEVEEKDSRIHIIRAVTLGRDNIVGGIYIITKP